MSTRIIANLIVLIMMISSLSVTNCGNENSHNFNYSVEHIAHDHQTDNHAIGSNDKSHNDTRKSHNDKSKHTHCHKCFNGFINIYITKKIDLVLDLPRFNFNLAYISYIDHYTPTKLGNSLFRPPIISA